MVITLPAAMTSNNGVHFRLGRLVESGAFLNKIPTSEASQAHDNGSAVTRARH